MVYFAVDYRIMDRWVSKHLAFIDADKVDITDIGTIEASLRKECKKLSPGNAIEVISWELQDDDFRIPSVTRG